MDLKILSFGSAKAMFENAKKEINANDPFVGDLVQQFGDEVESLAEPWSADTNTNRFTSIATTLYVLGAMTLILGRSVMDLEQRNKELEAKIDVLVHRKIEDVLAEKKR